MTLTVLINAGPWLPVPPPDYGGMEKVFGTLIPELRARGVEVVLCTVEESAVEVDDRRFAFPDGQFGRLAGPYAQVMGITHAHMATVLETLGERPDIDLVARPPGGGRSRACSGRSTAARRCSRPSTGTCASIPSSTAPSTARGGCSSTASPTPSSRTAPANLRRQSLGAVHLGVDLAAHRFQADKGEDYLVLGRVTPLQGPGRGRPDLQGAGDAAGHGRPGRRRAHPRGSCSWPSRTRPARCTATATSATTWTPCSLFEDGERIRWVGTVGGAAKDELVGRARAVLMPISWEEPGATAAIEALACGTPVIATRRGALPEIIEHGRQRLPGRRRVPVRPAHAAGRRDRPGGVPALGRRAVLGRGDGRGLPAPLQGGPGPDRRREATRGRRPPRRGRRPCRGRAPGRRSATAACSSRSSVFARTRSRNHSRNVGAGLDHPAADEVRGRVGEVGGDGEQPADRLGLLPEDASASGSSRSP